VSHVVKELYERKLVNCPAWLPLNTQYLTIMGSHAYGVADTSVKEKVPDYDVYGWCIPPKEYIFKHLTGAIPGFGPQPQDWEQWQQHHVMDVNALGGRGQEWDFNVNSIVKYFELCREGNPNMVDSLFTPENCVLHCTNMGRIVRDARKLFISKEVWARFRGYAFSQMHKMESKNPEGGRREIVEKFGYDVKFGYHILRLLDEVEQLLETGEMDLQRAREAMKSIRRGEWKLEDLKEWANEKSKQLDIAFTNSKLPAKPDMNKLKELLLSCLEEHYGSLEKCVSQTGWAEQALREIDLLLDTHRKKLYA
jgi:predicted nucleotidyltransferase